MTDTYAAAAETVQRIPLDRLALHPDNVRSTLGDLSDLVRSVKAQGVIVPALALPADEHGMHFIVAGNRRYAAAVKAEVADLPVIVRDLTPAEVLDAMLIENGQRSDLSLADSIRAVARYQVVAPTDTPTKIGRRIGRTPAWVKARLALALLPGDVLAMLDGGSLNMAQAAALAPVVALGDDGAVRDCANELAHRHGGDADRLVHNWLTSRDNAIKLDALLMRLDRTGVTRFADSHAARDAKAVPLGYDGVGLNQEQQRAHRHEPCHAVSVASSPWDHGKATVTSWCTQPKRHRGTDAKPAASELTVTTFGTSSKAAASELDRDRKHARVARHAAAAPLLATCRWPKADGIMLAARVQTVTVGSLAATKACHWLGIDTTLGEGVHYFDTAAALTGWLDDGGDPVRLLATLAAAELETYGRQVDPLPAGERWQAANALWLGMLTTRGGYTGDGNDLA